jgi:hypothetical protein
LLSNAALLTHADGMQSESEKRVLERLIQLLGFAPDEAQQLIDIAKEGALNLGTKPLEEI